MWIVLSYPNSEDRANYASGSFDTEQEANTYASEWEGPSERLDVLEVHEKREMTKPTE